MPQWQMFTLTTGGAAGVADAVGAVAAVASAAAVGGAAGAAGAAPGAVAPGAADAAGAAGAAPAGAGGAADVSGGGVALASTLALMPGASGRGFAASTLPPPLCRLHFVFSYVAFLFSLMMPVQLSQHHTDWPSASSARCKSAHLLSRS
eukprot:scaffold8777_cov48-Phaeocystis_antarctica.AAC.2